jgi:hypothetical protein
MSFFANQMGVADLYDASGDGEKPSKFGNQLGQGPNPRPAYPRSSHLSGINGWQSSKGPRPVPGQEQAMKPFKPQPTFNVPQQFNPPPSFSQMGPSRPPQGGDGWSSAYGRPSMGQPPQGNWRPQPGNMPGFDQANANAVGMPGPGQGSTAWGGSYNRQPGGMGLKPMPFGQPSQGHPVFSQVPESIGDQIQQRGEPMQPANDAAAARLGQQGQIGSILQHPGLQQVLQSRMGGAPGGGLPIGGGPGGMAGGK